MKTFSVKIGVFGCYLGAVLVVWSRPEISGWVALTAKTVLLYCSLIVIAHLASTFVQIWGLCRDWLRDGEFKTAAGLKTEST